MISFLKNEEKLTVEDRCRTILVEKTDRLYRNLKDWVTLDELDLQVHFVKEGVILSGDSRSSEKFMHGIKVLMAKNYIDNLSEETKKGMNEKASQGIFPSRAPLGYLNVTCGDKHFIQPDTERSTIIRKLYEWYATGNYSIQTLTKMAYESGLVYRKSEGRISKSNIQFILTNPIYYGDFNWHGKIYSGVHEPIISKDLWDKVQLVLKERSRNNSGLQKYDWAFQGLLKCGHCGCTMTAELKKGKYVYYHCTGHRGKCPEKYVREEELERQFSLALRAFTLDDDVLQ